ncbi:hypothetical protein BDR07DRAFT_1459477 [Suillus spraguei]|nr:hypothetical protein BDR07DRAFT_1459477 [Suillus spraguei]
MATLKNVSEVEGRLKFLFLKKESTTHCRKGCRDVYESQNGNGGLRERAKRLVIDCSSIPDFEILVGAMIFVDHPSHWSTTMNPSYQDSCHGWEVEEYVTGMLRGLGDRAAWTINTPLGLSVYQAVYGPRSDTCQR